jgi:nucleotide-binding universal stress UspA family protein
MKLIIAPTDFSTLSDNAIKYATDMATIMGMNLMLVNVYQLPISFSEVPLVTISLDQIRDISENKLAELKNNLQTITAGKLKIFTESRLGDVGEEVTKLTETLSPFAIVMGTRGTTGVGRFFMGSNSISVISKGRCPFLLFHPVYISNHLKKWD